MGSLEHERQKKAVALAAVERIPAGGVLGVGTGSTVDHLIALLPTMPSPIDAAVSSSEASTRLLWQHGIQVIPLEDLSSIPLYIDGADEVDDQRRLIKGGGGALTREKIVAEIAEQFLCIVDGSKIVDQLGAFPLPLEVIPMAVRLVTERVATFDARGHVRDGFTTDNGNLIVDVVGLDLSEPEKMENILDQIPGVVSNGIFARRRADQVLVARDSRVESF